MAEINGKQVSRSYTPTTSDDDLGHFDLLIKVKLIIRSCHTPYSFFFFYKSYPLGNISRKFSELKIGDEMAVRGPKGNFNYTANMCRAIGMIAGGTGITPMLQVKKKKCKP